MSVTAFTTAILLSTTAYPDAVPAITTGLAVDATFAAREGEALSDPGPVQVQPTQVQPTQAQPVPPPPVLAAPAQSPAPDQAAAPPPQPDAPAAATPPPAVLPPEAASAPPEEEEQGEIVVTARPRFVPGDPFLAINAQTFSVVQSVDKAFVGPVALKYKDTVPRPIRSGLRNFLSNLQEPVVFLNYLLQFKIGKAAETAGRFAVNTTLGLAGLFDSAKKHPFNLPHRNNGFGYTLGFYGVKPGPFLFLPLIGPTTLRDVLGRVIDISVLPFAVGRPFNDPLYVLPTTTIRLLDERAENDSELRALRDDSSDPYTAIKEDYLQRRQAEIDELRGRHKRDEGGAGVPMPVQPSPLEGITPETVRPFAPEAPPVVTTLPDVPVLDGLPGPMAPIEVEIPEIAPAGEAASPVPQER